MICCALAVTIIVAVLEFIRSARRLLSEPVRFVAIGAQTVRAQPRAFYIALAMTLVIGGATSGLWLAMDGGHALWMNALGSSIDQDLDLPFRICGLKS